MLALAVLTYAGEVAAQSGLPARPANPSCVAPPRPLSGTAAAIDVQSVFNVGGQPTAMHQSATDPTRWWVALKLGVVRRVTWNPDDPGPAVSADAVDLRDRVVVNPPPEAGLAGMTFHPQFATNGWVYVHYTGTNVPGATGPFTAYVSRFTSHDGGLTIDPASETVLLALPQNGQFHQGGRLAFGPDGYLYASFGDGGVTMPQNLATWYASILRIDVDRGVPYAIPADNPFATGGGAPELFAWGLRNAYSFSFDRVTGELWAGDVGEAAWEEIDRVVKGGNYGWPVTEGNHCVAEGCDPSPYQPPVVEHRHSSKGGDGLAIIGGYVYRGSAIPALYGRYVYGDWNGNLWALGSDAGGNPVPELLRSGLNPITGFYEDAAGELYLLSSPVLKIVPATTPPATAFPQTLSATGCRDASDPTLPASGVIPYDVNVELWSDGAAKGRWLAVPDGETIDILPSGDLSFPVGTVLMKDFDLAGRLIETRLFVRHDDGGWAGYSYWWDDDLTDASLLPGGATRAVGGQTWLYPSRAQCIACHTVVAGSSLGPTIPQLNRGLVYPSTGITANQLTTLHGIGMFSGPLPGPPSTLPFLPGPAHPAEPITRRARGYLEANCAFCHTPGGPTQAAMDLRFDASDAAMNVCDVPPALGDLGVPGARLLAPGNPAASIISHRVHALDGDRMPPLGTSLVDPIGSQLIDDWITTTTSCGPANAAPSVTIETPATGATFTAGAPVGFAGVATDQEDGVLTAGLTWTSSLDGAIGSGGSITATALSLGTHMITASVTDGGGLSAAATITVQITPPVVTPVEVTFGSIAVEDGDIIESTESSGVGNLIDATGPQLYVGDHLSDRQFRGILSFDTSSIPDDAVMVSATVRVRRAAALGTNPFTTLGPCTVDVQTGPFGASAALEPTDFQAVATAPAAATLTNAPANGAWSTGAFSAAGVAAVNRMGVTQLRLAFALDDDDDAITDVVRWGSGDNPDPAYRPQLVVAWVTGAPTVTVTGPAAGAQFEPGAPVAFAGQAIDTEQGTLSAQLAWTSDLDGPIGSGAAFTTTTLSLGTHTITAAVTDATGLTGRAAVRVVIAVPPPNTSPVVTITSPGSGAAFAVGAPVSFAATAVDAEDGVLAAGLAWTSSIDGPLGTGGAFATSTLSPGTHTISAQVTDGGGLPGAAAIVIEVRHPGATPIEMIFTSIGAEDGDIIESTETSGAGNIVSASSGEIYVGDHLTDRQFRGVVSFDTSGLPDGATVVAATIRVRRVAALGASPFAALGPCTADVQRGHLGASLALEPGDFEAAATVPQAATLSEAATNGAWSTGAFTAAGAAAIDPGGRTQVRLAFTLDDDDDQITDVVRWASGDHADPASRPQLVVSYVPPNTAPVVVVTAPASGAVLAAGTPVTFTGAATDAEDGDLTAALVWTSDRDGTIGTGGSVTTAGLSAGRHTITAAVIDGLGSLGAHALDLVVRVPVEVTFVSLAGEDGTIEETGEHTGVGGTAGFNGSTLQIGDRANDRQLRAVLSFDTASIPDEATLLSATVRVRRASVSGTNPFETHGSCVLDVQYGAFGTAATLEAADFQAPATAPQAGALGSALSDGDWAAGALTPAGLAAVNAAGRTQVRLAFPLDDNDDQGADTIAFNAGDSPVTAQRPQLVVRYLE